MSYAQHDGDLICAAARDGDLSHVSALVARGVSPNARESQFGSTPLHWSGQVRPAPRPDGTPPLLRWEVTPKRGDQGHRRTLCAQSACAPWGAALCAVWLHRTCVPHTARGDRHHPCVHSWLASVLLPAWRWLTQRRGGPRPGLVPPVLRPSNSYVRAATAPSSAAPPLPATCLSVALTGPPRTRSMAARRCTRPASMATWRWPPPCWTGAPTWTRATTTA